MTLKNNPNIIVVKRKKNAVIKNPYIYVSEEEENYYYSLMLLYLPFRNVKEILGDFTNVKETYEKKANLLKVRMYQKHFREVEK